MIPLEDNTGISIGLHQICQHNLKYLTYKLCWHFGVVSWNKSVNCRKMACHVTEVAVANSLSVPNMSRDNDDDVAT